MRRAPLVGVLTLGLSLSAAGGAAPPPGTPAEALAGDCARLLANQERLPEGERLHALFDAAWRFQMREFPEFATLVGYPGQNRRFTDSSPEAIERRHQALQPPLRVLRAIDRARLSPPDRLNYDLFLRGLEEAVEGIRFKGELLAVTQLGGPQQGIAQVIAFMRAATVADYEDILARLGAVPALVDQTIALLRKGLAAGVTPPRVTLRDVPDQVRAQITDDPLQSPVLQPFTRFPDDMKESDRARLREAAARVYATAVRPAFERLRAYLADTYIPATRETMAMSALPDGEAWYAYNVRMQTTTRLTPRQIHDLGLAEVKRLRAAMDAVIKETGFKGGFSEFTAFLRTDPRFFFADAADLVREYRDICKRADPELVRLFGRLPRLPYGVIPVPAYAEKSQTTAYYEPGSPEGARPGYYFVNTYDLKSRPRWEMEALSLHEAVPGHHLQIALAQELDLPEFRKHGGYTAFVEGWALYAESLGSEIGMYRDPYSRFGQLTYEMWRAIRLVVDTGLHALGWTRQQAIDYFLQNSAKTEHDVVVEVDRYIVSPGQALAYKLGELKIKELRAHASAALGTSFDVRAFHDEILVNGALPLDALDSHMRAWVESRGK